MSKHVKVAPGRALYKGKFPHVLTLEHYAYYYDDSSSEWYSVIPDFVKVSVGLKKKLNTDTDTVVATRQENRSLRIYTTDLELVLDSLPAPVRRSITSIEAMDDHVLSHVIAPKETFRTITKVVRKLPYGKYRYRVHYANSSSLKRKIGSEALRAILFQLKQHPGIKLDAQIEKQMTNLLTIWQDTYFYSEGIDWLPVVALIDNRFVKRIEQFTLESDLEQQVSTDIS